MSCRLFSILALLNVSSKARVASTVLKRDLFFSWFVKLEGINMVEIEGIWEIVDSILLRQV